MRNDHLIFAVTSNASLHSRSCRVGSLHQEVYHGAGEYRTLVEWEPISGVNDQGENCVITRPPDWRWPAVTNPNREPLHVTRNGRFIPSVFGELESELIVSPEVQIAMKHLENIAFNTVVFEHLVDLAMPALGDFSWYKRRDLERFDFLPRNLIRSLPHDPSFESKVSGFRFLLPALFEDLAEEYSDIETWKVNFGTYHSTVMDPEEVRFSRRMFKTYPIIHSDCLLFRGDAFAAIAPFLDLDYFAIAVIHLN